MVHPELAAFVIRLQTEKEHRMFTLGPSKQVSRVDLQQDILLLVMLIVTENL